MSTDLRTNNRPYLIDAIFWIAVSTLIGVVLWLPAGRSQAYIWLMLAVGVVISSKNLWKSLLMAIDLATHAEASETVVFEGRADYSLKIGPIRMANQEKPFYYTLFTRNPIVPYLFNMKTADGATRVFSLSLSRRTFLQLGVKAGQPIRITYLKRSRAIRSFSLLGS